MNTTVPVILTAPAYASLWRRFAAALFDVGLGLTVAVAMAFIFGVVFGKMGLFAAIGLSSMLWWLYSAGMESSDMQSTLGGRIFSTRVSDANGERLSFWRASARQSARIGLVLLVAAAASSDVTAVMVTAALAPLAGFIVAAFMPKKQALFDLAARTVVTAH